MKRNAWTLVEMIIVISIMLVLAALGTAFLPKFLDNQYQVRAVDQISQWLLTAKQRAKRDGVPTGVRILFNSVTLQATQMQYVQQPEPYTAGVCISVNPLSNGRAQFQANSVDFVGADPFGGGGSFSLIQNGDYLELNGGGPVYVIIGVDSQSLILANTQIQLNAPTANYRILRQPRPLLGEDVLSLPQDMIVDNSLSNPNDLTSSYSKNVPARSIVGDGGRATFYEITFSPTGTVIGQTTPSGKIILWVRNATKPVNDPGAVTLIAVSIRTGFITAHPINISVPTIDPKTGISTIDLYLFTEDGKSSGM